MKLTSWPPPPPPRRSRRTRASRPSGRATALDRALAWLHRTWRAARRDARATSETVAEAAPLGAERDRPRR